jgi:hypothetical protein
MTVQARESLNLLYFFDALDHYLKLWPKTSLDNFGPMVGTAAFNNSMERVREGLRLAGLPE